MTIFKNLSFENLLKIKSFAVVKTLHFLIQIGGHCFFLGLCSWCAKAKQKQCRFFIVYFMLFYFPFLISHLGRPCQFSNLWPHLFSPKRVIFLSYISNYLQNHSHQHHSKSAHEPAVCDNPEECLAIFRGIQENSVPCQGFSKSDFSPASLAASS